MSVLGSQVFGQALMDSCDDHKIKFDIILILFKDQETKNEHIWEDHPRHHKRIFIKAWWCA